MTGSTATKRTAPEGTSRTDAGNATVAYIVSRFPKLSETFILREIVELRRQGRPVELFPLLHHREPVQQREVAAIEPHVRYTPFLSLPIVAANLRALLTRPVRYLGALAATVRTSWRSPEVLVKSLVYFPKSVFLARELERRQVVHVHAHFATYPALAAHVVHRLTGIGYSLTVHAHDIFIHTQGLCTKLRPARFVAAISRFNKDYLLELCPGLEAERIDVIHCGVRLDDYPLRTTYRRQGGRFTVLTVARLTAYKGIDFLIRACGRLREEVPELDCRIVGDGEEREALEALVVELDLAGTVRLEGPLPHTRVSELLGEADLFALPSYRRASGEMDGIPVSLMEAMACGVPVVASRVSGIPELVEDGVSGLLVPPRDDASLARAIARLARDEELRAELGRAGRRKVAREFTLEGGVALLHRRLARTLGE